MNYVGRNLFGFPQIEVGFSTYNTLIFEVIIKEIEAYLLRESNNTDSTDSIFDFLTTLSDQIQSDSIKNSFLGHCQIY